MYIFTEKKVHIGEGAASTPAVVWRELRDQGQRRDFVNVQINLRQELECWRRWQLSLPYFGLLSFASKITFLRDSSHPK